MWNGGAPLITFMVLLGAQGDACIIISAQEDRWNHKSAEHTLKGLVSSRPRGTSHLFDWAWLRALDHFDALLISLCEKNCQKCKYMFHPTKSRSVGMAAKGLTSAFESQCCKLLVIDKARCFQSWSVQLKDAWHCLPGRFVVNKVQGISPGCWVEAQPRLLNINWNEGQAQAFLHQTPVGLQADESCCKENTPKTQLKSVGTNLSAFSFVSVVWFTDVSTQWTYTH